MKKIAGFVLIAFLACSCTIVREVKLNDIHSNMCMVHYYRVNSNKGKAIIDYGAPKYKGARDILYILDDKNFNSIIDVSSYLLSKGWEFKQSIPLSIGSGINRVDVAHFIFVYPVDVADAEQSIPVLDETAVIPMQAVAGQPESSVVSEVVVSDVVAPETPLRPEAVTEALLNKESIQEQHRTIRKLYSDNKEVERYKAYNVVYMTLFENLTGENMKKLQKIQSTMINLVSKPECDLDQQLKASSEVEKRIAVFYNY